MVTGATQNDMATAYLAFKNENLKFLSFYFSYLASHSRHLSASFELAQLVLCRKPHTYRYAPREIAHGNEKFKTNSVLICWTEQGREIIPNAFLCYFVSASLQYVDSVDPNAINSSLDRLIECNCATGKSLQSTSSTNKRSFRCLQSDKNML